MPTTGDPTVAAAVEAVRLDNRLQARVAALVDLALDGAEQDLLHGTPHVRQRLYGTLIPALLRTLGDETKDEQLEEIRQEQRRLYDLFQQGVADPTAGAADDAPIPEDAPPPKAKPKPRARRGS